MISDGKINRAPSLPVSSMAFLGLAERAIEHGANRHVVRLLRGEVVIRCAGVVLVLCIAFFDKAFEVLFDLKLARDENWRS
jgi:hypothetical protein